MATSTSMSSSRGSTGISSLTEADSESLPPLKRACINCSHCFDIFKSHLTDTSSGAAPVARVALGLGQVIFLPLENPLGTAALLSDT